MAADFAPPGSEVRHATCVALPSGQGALIVGPSGSGKSSLALQMMGLGARLVADDRTILTPGENCLRATCPPPTRGVIEARGVGLLRVAYLPAAEVILVVDLGETETERLPPQREIVILGQPLDLVHGPITAHFPSALLHYLAQGRSA